ncbi:MAG: hypothetical protein JWN03_5725 [Nocardia sp.]|uniref:hypothetical protein n=1 Tax=Nocardia sp. TaxID=1821 RepID=UPI00263748FB|nr:hypothetical protein [Nocardia sp.]MCU1645450.1 hypothetical protein [Nocardia sp.]
MTSEINHTTPTRQSRRNGVRWIETSHHREPAQALLRGNRLRRGATAAGQDATVGYDFNCPTCQHDDQVQSVPAIRASGTATSFGSDYYSGVGIGPSGLVPVFGSTTIERTRSTRLAQSLAPEPAQRRTGKLILLGLILSMPALLIAVAAVIGIVEPHKDVSVPLYILVCMGYVFSLATPSLLLLTAAVLRRRRNNRIIRGRHAARSVWNAGYYCHRCGYCFWPYAVAPGIPAQQSFSPNDFRRIVWSAGDYANI